MAVGILSRYGGILAVLVCNSDGWLVGLVGPARRALLFFVRLLLVVVALLLAIPLAERVRAVEILLRRRDGPARRTFICVL